METKIKKLCPRQFRLREFLDENSSEWKSSKEIANGVEGYDNPSTAYKTINSDVHAINRSGTFDQIIITDRTKGYKLATKEEFGEWASKAFSEAVRKITYVHGIIKDAKMDGQGIIPGLEGFRREFYEKFVKEEENAKKTNPI